MKIYYFSPTGGTKKVAEMIAEGFKNVRIEDILVKNPSETVCKEGEAVMFAVPVFSGRIPDAAAKRIKAVTAKGNPVVLVAVYGNREFEDALAEMDDLAKEQGFTVIAAVAALARHSLSLNVAEGRPDVRDQKELKKIGETIQNILEQGKPYKDVSNEIPGNRPYREVKKSDVCSYYTDACIKCGKCAEVCPEQIISKEDFQVSKPDQCIMCKACVNVCPSGARCLPEAFEKMIQEKLKPLENVRKEIQCFGI